MPERSELTRDPVGATRSGELARCRPGQWCAGRGDTVDASPARQPDGGGRRIEEILGDLDDGAHVVEVTGGPGIGRTRLLAEIARLAGAREIRVFSGAAPPDGVPLPAGPAGGRVRPGRPGQAYPLVDAVHALLEPYLSTGGPLVVVLDVPLGHPSGPGGSEDATGASGVAAPEPGGPPVATARSRRSQRRAGRAVPAALTNRERQVAELAGDGLTNREIAAALFVTEKTVEMHLTHVFAKLDVRNRVGLARRLHATGRSE
ncbi:LuxR C-terminal-related transcriptional regulator [Micromonospora sp. WMMD1102]|uniref:LuxR C-terminal-related transcriptional regulator n=1 Tax=Micromonospora sp. WMMD1102 TaxID=3016105 RepID=UPI0024157823|nr:LuxR C-terminal-related transcriptional regulator [Micromonospora sp. WMMD1102]MDG4787868.1 LuxR C-terminal-related transcriptional regulator [Micromonospora sp. WMMD1102]